MDYFRRVDTPKKVTKDTILSSTATPNTHAIGRSSSSLIDQSGDRDWFKVNLVAGNTYKFTVTGQGSFDPLLRLRTANGTMILENDDADSRTRDSLINFKATTTGSYYLDVGGYKTSAGAYVLTSGLLKTNPTVHIPSASSRVLPSPPTTSRLSGIRDSILPQFNATRQLQSQSARLGALALGTAMRPSPFSSSNLSRSGFVMDSLISAASSSAYSTYY
jgi:hypothetical protein